MTFKRIDPKSAVRFNSAISSEFLDLYENAWRSDIVTEDSKIPSKTIAPSSFRCRRRTWFRLRGVQPDITNDPDTGLDFSAEVGTMCHRVIQTRLKTILQENWLSVPEYIDKNANRLLYPQDRYKISLDIDNLESKIVLTDPPIHFACDGLICFNNTVYLLEIKTCDFNIWKDLTCPKSEHIDQVKCYCTVLNIHNVIMLYQDRTYGNIKCYELYVKDSDMDAIESDIQSVVSAVDTNIAPSGLPVGDKWCTPNMCQYYKKCQEYGRW